LYLINITEPSQSLIGCNCKIKQSMKQYFFIIAIAVFISPFFSSAQEDAKDILTKSEEYLRGTTNIAEMKMTIIRPKWTREMQMKVWSIGDTYSLIYMKAPKRDEGTTFLKRDKEIWNWVPSIERVVKMPPAMMLQSWMGSDFTNDDLVRGSSIIDDYDHKVIGEENVEGKDCYVIELIPKPEAPIVWGKVKNWISKEDYLQLKIEFYDEDDFLVNTMAMTEIKDLGGKTFPTKMMIIPEEDPENKTLIEYIDMEFDAPLEESFFTVNSMKRIRE